MKKIEKIEKFYDIKVYFRGSVDDDKNNQINSVYELIEKGYLENLHAEKTVIAYEGLEQLNMLYSKAIKTNSFYLGYRGKFYCKFLGAEFCIGDVLIIAGEYQISLNDIKQKIDTYVEGDLRRVTFEAKEGFNTYFIVDESRARNSIKMQKSALFSVDKMEIREEFIYEK